MLGRVLGHHARGRYDDAIAEGRRPVALDPVSPPIRAGLGHTLLYARRYDEAVEACTQALELEPDFVPAHIFLALTYHLSGRGDLAIARAGGWSNWEARLLRGISR